MGFGYLMRHLQVNELIMCNVGPKNELSVIVCVHSSALAML